MGMKRNKLIALLLTSVIAAGAVASCNSSTDPSATDSSSETTATSATSAPTPTDVPPDLEGFKELTVAEVTDKDDGKITIYAHNSEFIGLVEKYVGITSDDYDLVEVSNNNNAYQEKLDAVLSDGNNAPDIFTCDAAYARKYLASDNTIAINDLGIDYAECKNMFGYTLRFASDDNNVIKGLSWKAAPCGVFYERSVAEQYLGTSDPNELAASFATWDKVMESARKVDSASGGKVKLIGGFTEIFEPYVSTKDGKWIMDGRIQYDPKIEDFFEYAKTLYSENLTFKAEQWSKSWTSKMSDRTVVSYWGSLQFAKYQLALNPGEGTTVNPTSGDWGLTTAPVNYYSGGTWVMASKYCDKKATSGDIIRAICINEDNQKDMLGNGEFVNNIKLITAAASDDKFAYEWLGGQNPYPVLLNAAKNADASYVIVGEDDFNQTYKAVVGTYAEGAFKTKDEAKKAFEKQLKEDGLIE